MRNKASIRAAKGRYDVPGINRTCWGDRVPKNNTRQLLDKDTQERYNEYCQELEEDEYYNEREDASIERRCASGDELNS